MVNKFYITLLLINELLSNRFYNNEKNEFKHFEFKSYIVLTILNLIVIFNEVEC